MSNEAQGDPAVVGCILAGGLARRMGGCDKPLLPLGGKVLLAHMIEALSPQVGTLMLNANGDPGRFSGFGLPIAADPVEGFAGPLAGVLAGMRWTQANAPKATYIVSAAADTPFFPQDLVARLKVPLGDEPGIAIAACGGKRHSVFGLWPVALADDLAAWLANPENRKVLAWVERHRNLTVEFPPHEGRDPFFNINTPTDLAEAERILADPSHQRRPACEKDEKSEASA
ncbi:molybdenum cofactor guanylyltransferase [Breoghania corrubedonensis]|uniref:Molybdenum cofactor guanylyltransferase n=1 Tax=Breoghania corrubedonensis TaxID=665038 RepID=A0A2T5V1B3_9HYPH|nr:molybdenum cofactor guanylyltransferase MobA [Breoghania corrubedonensis]PTW57549.1 molybdenum cofactor guanylyltransferase [Breoghania corrubedonensis]